MTKPTQLRYGCSPWSLMGCGCGLLATIGILLIFLILSINFVHERRDPRWNRTDYALCQDNISYLHQAIVSYQRDYHHLPPTLDALRSSYLDRPSRLSCPLHRHQQMTEYIYHPDAKRPTDTLIECRIHGQGSIVLERDGKIRLPDIFHRK